MKKRIISLISLVFLSVLLSFTNIKAVSKGSIDVQIETNDGIALQDIDVKLYKIADYIDNTFIFTDEFKDSDIDLEKLHSSSNAEIEANKCLSYIIEKGILQVQNKKSDSKGIASFQEVEEGLYLIIQSSNHEEFTFASAPFWVSVPMNDENGVLTYHVKVKPKNTVEYPKEFIEYTVNKCWIDNNDSHKKRPKQIHVELYANDKLKERISLNALNNWSYSWSELEEGIQWSVKEINVSEYYQVKVEQKGTQFIITNTFNEEDVETNDTSHMRDYMVMLMISVSVMMGIGIFKEVRKRKYIK